LRSRIRIVSPNPDPVRYRYRHSFKSKDIVVALLDSEIQRIRFELGYTVMGVNAEPYLEYFGTIDRIVSLYLNAGATTTSSTTVAVASTLTQRTLTLASATGFSAGATVYIDVLPQQERAMVQSVSGSTIVVYLQKAHVGTYPVTVDGGEAIIREKLAQLYDIDLKTSASINTAGLKRVDDIEFYGGTKATSQATMLAQLRDMRRDELASALGVANLHRIRKGQGQCFSVY
jgi:hypothetical protein